MSAFSYTAVDREGRSKRGVLEAASAAAARDLLRERDLAPVEMVPVESRSDQKRGAVQGPSWLAARPALGRRELAIVIRQLATLLGAGVTTERALAVSARQARRSSAEALLLDLRTRVMEGEALSAAMERHGAVFPDALRASIRAGERSGRLAGVLARLAGFVEQGAKNARSIALALVYPALLAVVAGGMIVLLLTLVVPDIVTVFETRGAALPVLTRMLIAVSEGLQAYGLWMLAGLAGAGLSARALIRARRTRWHQFIYTRSPLKGFSVQLNSARFAATMATLVQSGVPVLDALMTAAGTAPNHYVRDRLKDAAARVREGASLTGALTGAACFSPLLLTMVESGEAGGELGECLERAAKDEQEALDQAVATLVALVEPAVLLTMGGVVLLLVLAILAPIVALNDLAAF